VIRLAETTIEETAEQYPGINLTSARTLLQDAIGARDDERFPDAESLAGQANDAAEEIAREYEAAQTAINDADAQISQANSEGRNTAAASQLLQTARAEFAAGNYVPARDSAEDAVSAIGSAPEEPQMPLFVIVAAVVAAGGGIGAMLFLRSRKPAIAVTRSVGTRGGPADSTNNSDPGIPNGVPDQPGESSPEIPITPPPPEVERIIDRQIDSPATVPESQIDTSVLSRIVGKIVEEKPHLRPEDQDVLRYLADKEGAAFESEIRTKFQLPKTTIWRLVKRLEREELVEIRKAGGQNLIKLKFENRQP
jgi:hypothetical protein